MISARPAAASSNSSGVNASSRRSPPALRCLQASRARSAASTVGVGPFIGPNSGRPDARLPPRASSTGRSAARVERADAAWGDPVAERVRAYRSADALAVGADLDLRVAEAELEARAVERAAALSGLERLVDERPAALVDQADPD